MRFTRRFVSGLGFLFLASACAAETAGSTDQSGQAETAGACAEPAPPQTLKDTKPAYPVFVDKGGKPVNFPCYGACGASCNLQQKRDETVTTCEESPCGDRTRHRFLAYRKLTGDTHTFCTWHDSCYLQCSESFENGSPSEYKKCTRWCDFGCVSSAEFNRDQAAGSFDPHTATPTPLGRVVLAATGNDDDRNRWIAVTKGAGPVPQPQTWHEDDCGIWALTAIDSNGITDTFASTDGTAVFSALEGTSEWQDGRCPQ